ncbi:MAG TPA: ATP-binding protein [Sulfuricurvum sp.]|nr:ATP-binding protein [Sulfuricurvum sp.]
MKKIILLVIVAIYILWSEDAVPLAESSEIDFWLLAAIVAIVVTVGLSYKYRRLDELVRQRTAELEILNQQLQDKIDKAVEKNRTQEKILMQQAKMAEIGSMVESIAHQWRQPLNILGLSMTRLGINHSLGKSQNIGEIIEIAEQQIGYMSQTIDDFRNFFKQDRLQSNVNVNQLISEVETLLGPLLESKRIVLVKDIDPSIEILVYHNELKQVLINVVNNAREAIEFTKSEKRQISIRCSDDGEHCVILIEDSGGGVPANIIDKIFDPYFTTKFESQGTGIGLYMAKMIIEKHCFGKLNVKNTKNGACFEIQLNHSNGIQGRERRGGGLVNHP